MATIVLRNVKGSALTSTEMDDNITNLNNELVISGSIDTANKDIVLNLRDTSTVDISYQPIVDEAIALSIALG